jgi:cytidyltransferase-like protein
MSHSASARENLLAMGASHLEQQALLFLDDQQRASSGGAFAVSTPPNATATESIVQTIVGPLQQMLVSYGLVEEECLPGRERLLFTVVAVLATFVVLAVEWRRRVQSLSRRLREAEASVRFLNDKLHMSHPSSSSSSASHPKKEIRIFMVRWAVVPFAMHVALVNSSCVFFLPAMYPFSSPILVPAKDGAFDLLHYGHMNAFRLARSLGTHLIVGLNSDESISECKGPPLMKDDERLTMVSACKFVDEVIPGCPYVVRFCAVSDSEVSIVSCTALLTICRPIPI